MEAGAAREGFREPLDGEEADLGISRPGHPGEGYLAPEEGLEPPTSW